MAMWQNYFWNRNSDTKEIDKRKHAHSQQNLAVFLAATDSENIIIQILDGKGQIKNLARIVINRTGTYL